MTEGRGLVDQAWARVRGIEKRIDQLRQLRQERLEQLATVNFQLRDNPGEPDLLQKAEGLRLAIAELDRQTPRGNYRPGDARPLLQLELEQAKQELEDVRRSRYRTAQTLELLESQEAEWGERLPRILAGLDDLLSAFGPGHFPERHREAETQLRALRVWAVNMHNDLRGLDGWRSRLADFGPDDGYLPPEVRERGIFGAHPESVRSKLYG